MQGVPAEEEHKLISCRHNGKDEIGPWITDNEKLPEFLERPQVRLVREQDSGQIRMDFGIDSTMRR
ncbi:MAG: hypothetical protein MJ128_02470 [Mogibacterium sp.]|nr:hypothetical protein [Mogibacterium sp.]